MLHSSLRLVKAVEHARVLLATWQERADRQDDGKRWRGATTRRTFALLHDSWSDRDPPQERRGPDQHLGGMGWIHLVHQLQISLCLLWAHTFTAPCTLCKATASWIKKVARSSNFLKDIVTFPTELQIFDGGDNW